jgi:hypothetical protein
MGTATDAAATRVLVIPKEQMIRLLHEEPGFSDRFFEYMLSRNIRIEEDLGETGDLARNGQCMTATCAAACVRATPLTLQPDSRSSLEPNAVDWHPPTSSDASAARSRAVRRPSNSHHPTSSGRAPDVHDFKSATGLHNSEICCL